MGGPSYTSKWQCKECGQLYGHNPSECDVCGHTLFRPLPADGASETSADGEETTELGAEVSELVMQANPSKHSEKSVDDGATRGRENNTKSEATEGFLSRLLPWL